MSRIQQNQQMDVINQLMQMKTVKKNADNGIDKQQDFMASLGLDSEGLNQVESKLQYSQDERQNFVHENSLNTGIDNVSSDNEDSYSAKNLSTEVTSTEVISDVTEKNLEGFILETDPTNGLSSNENFNTHLLSAYGHHADTKSIDKRVDKEVVNLEINSIDETFLDFSQVSSHVSLEQVIDSQQPIIFSFDEIDSAAEQLLGSPIFEQARIKDIVTTLSEPMVQNVLNESTYPTIFEIVDVPLTSIATGKLSQSAKSASFINNKAIEKTIGNNGVNNAPSSFESVVGTIMQMKSSSQNSHQSMSILALNTQVSSEKALKRVLSEAAPAKFNPAFQELLHKKFTIVTNSEGQVSIWYRDYFENEAQVKEMLERVQQVIDRKFQLKQIVFNGKNLFTSEEQ